MTDRVVCRRAASAPNREARRRLGLRDLRRAACADCGDAVLISPSGRALVADGADPVCDVCAARAAVAGGQPAHLLLTPEAAAEVEERRRAAARRAGVPLEDVGAWPPGGLRAALDAGRRQN